MKDKLERDVSIYKGTDDGFSIEICKNCEPYDIQDEDVLILEVLVLTSITLSLIFIYGLLSNTISPQAII